MFALLYLITALDTFAHCFLMLCLRACAGIKVNTQPSCPFCFGVILNTLFFMYSCMYYFITFSGLPIILSSFKASVKSFLPHTPDIKCDRFLSVQDPLRDTLNRG